MTQASETGTTAEAPSPTARDGGGQEHDGGDRAGKRRDQDGGGRDLSGKVAVVTGGASGIGRGIAEELTKRGCRVVVADIDEAGVTAVAGELGARGLVVDVADADSVARLAEQVVAEFGAVHIVCNNAGVGPSGAVSELSLEDWRWIFDVNFFGVVHGTHAFLPHLRTNGSWGHIVNTSSMSLLAPPVGVGSYVATKAAVLGMSEVLAKELAEEGADIGVTALLPGPVTTNIKDSLRHRAAPAGRTALRDIDLRAERSGLRFIEPREVGVLVAEAIVHNRLYAVTHDEWLPPVAQRHEAIEESFAWAASLV